MTDEFVALQEVVAGRFSVDREIGRGGMGVVYLARDVALDRPVAIKVLPAALACESMIRERFLREARTAAGLSHPNIVPIHTVEEHEQIVFFVMGFVDGETLRERIERDGPLPADDGAVLLREVAWALGLAHARGVIHRDIKPDNILIERATGRAMVTDFGIARPAEASELTGHGEVVGTVHYMSPEQATASNVDARSDLYSLGVTGFLALSGELPFDGPHAPAIIAKHLSELPPALGSFRDLPPSLSGAIDRCLQKDPAERFADADEFARAVSASIDGNFQISPEGRKFVRNLTENWYGLLIIWAAALAGVGLTDGFGLMIAGGGVLFTLLGVVSAGASARENQKDGLTVEEAIRAYEQARTDRALAKAKRKTGWAYRHRRWIGFVFGVQLLSVAAFLPLVILSSGAPLTIDEILLLILAVAYIGGGGVFGIAVGFSPDVVDRWIAFTDRLTERFERNDPVPGLIRRLFRVFGTGPASSRPVIGAAPTERIVLDAAEALVAELPPDVRGRLGRVNDVVQGLENKASALRRRLAELDDAAGAAGRVDVGADEQVVRRREELIGRVEASRDEVASKLATVVAAMENVRIGLIQLKAGVMTVDEITEELGRAEELRHRIDAELDLNDALS